MVSVKPNCAWGRGAWHAQKQGDVVIHIHVWLKT